jgi:carnitine-CoA ligase
VVPRDRETFAPEAVFTRCATRLERSHVPDFLQVVDDLPRTASEKVQVRFLVQQLDESAGNVFSRPTVAA